MNRYYEWQYNGAAPLRDILAWCRTHLPPHSSWHYNGYETIVFWDPRAYTLFLLKWS